MWYIIVRSRKQTLLEEEVKMTSNIYCVKGFCSKESDANIIIGYKSKAAAKKRFNRMIKSICYEKVTLSLQNSVYFSDTELILNCWELSGAE